MNKHSLILILDFGSQYTQLIARRVREMGYYSFVLPGSASLDHIKEMNPKALILSGGPASVYDQGAPTLPAGFWEFQRQESLPLLGICYGLQLIIHTHGGSVEQAAEREYGRMKVNWRQKSPLWSDSAFPNHHFFAWMSHGDETKKVPPGFEVVAKSEGGAIAAIQSTKEKVFALQFHPEVTHTEGGGSILEGFLIQAAGLKPDWEMQSFLEEEVARLEKKISKDAHAICALSGGVDSTVAATLVHRVMGDRLHCVFVDHGLLRKNEQKRVMDTFQSGLQLPVTCVDASKEFLSALQGVSDPEQKRKIIGSCFIDVFREYAHQTEKRIGKFPEFLIQGTLYPDVIESSPSVVDGAGKFQHSKTIKSHHNVGGLPKDLPFQLIEPMRDLFKDEVRQLGRVMKIPEEFIARHPFPGPGLAVRILGDLNEERIRILQEADAVYIDALREFGLYDKIWQAFAIFLPVKTVGVQGDNRTHDYVIALRAVTSHDGMTADWYRFDGDFLAEVSNRISNRVQGVNRVVYDISSKPPATIEWE